MNVLGTFHLLIARRKSNWKAVEKRLQAMAVDCRFCIRLSGFGMSFGVSKLNILRWNFTEIFLSVSETFFMKTRKSDSAIKGAEISLQNEAVNLPKMMGREEEEFSTFSLIKIYIMMRFLFSCKPHSLYQLMECIIIRFLLYHYTNKNDTHIT